MVNEFEYWMDWFDNQEFKSIDGDRYSIFGFTDSKPFCVIDRNNDRIAIEFTGAFECAGVWAFVRNGMVHNDADLPAMKTLRYSIMFCENGAEHRLSGPSIFVEGGKHAWAINNRRYTLKEFLELSDFSEEQKLELVLKYG